MNEIQFEDIHKASEAYPYLDFSMQNINYIAHFHEEIELIYVLSGSVQVTSDQKNYMIETDDICFFMPGEIHSFSTPSKSRLFIYKLMPPAHSAHDFFLLRPVCSKLKYDHPNYHEIKSLLFRIKEEDEKKEPGYKLAVNRDVNQIFLLLRRGIPSLSIHTDEQKQIMKKLQLFTSVNEFICENYMHEITLDSAASFFGYSRYYFAHWFRETANISFMEFVTLYRLKKATHLLRLTNKSVADIAFSCGFGSTRTFHRLFLRHFSCTPMQYRNAKIQQNE